MCLKEDCVRYGSTCEREFRKKVLTGFSYYKNYQRRKGELFDTLYVPSSFLKNNRLCLWVGTPQKRDGFREGHDFLLPYFVHEGGFASRRKVRKTLVFSENIETISDSDQNMQRLYRNGLLAHLHLVSGAENANANPGPPHVIKLNLQKASEAVNEMRCRGDADQYLRTWNESNANSVLKWLQSHSFREGQILSTALCEYIAYTIKSAIFKFSREKEEAEKDAKNNLPSQKSATQPPDSTDLWTVIQKWSENAHTELKEELEAARHGRVWASLIWWKLPLRSDEVNMYLTELLERHWLVNTEKELIWICGRLEQAKTAPLSYSDSGSPLFASWKEFPSASGSALKDKTLISTKLPDLSEVRRTLATTTIPPLAAQAQSLIVHAGSKTFFTGALAMLVYVSPPLTSFSTLSEAGAIAALGLAFSSYSLQKKWGAAKSTWLEIVRERGRQNLNDIEKWLGDIVKSPSANQRTDPPMSHMPSNEVLRRQEMAWKALIRAQREFGILRRANEQAFIDNQRGKNLKGTNDPVASDAAAAVVTTPKSDQQMDGSEPTVSYYHI